MDDRREMLDYDIDFRENDPPTNEVRDDRDILLSKLCRYFIDQSRSCAWIETFDVMFFTKTIEELIR